MEEDGDPVQGSFMVCLDLSRVSEGEVQSGDACRESGVVWFKDVMEGDQVQFPECTEDGGGDGAGRLLLFGEVLHGGADML